MHANPKKNYKIFLLKKIISKWFKGLKEKKRATPKRNLNPDWPSRWRKYSIWKTKNKNKKRKTKTRILFPFSPIFLLFLPPFLRIRKPWNPHQWWSSSIPTPATVAAAQVMPFPSNSPPPPTPSFPPSPRAQRAPFSRPRSMAAASPPRSPFSPRPTISTSSTGNSNCCGSYLFALLCLVIDFLWFCCFFYFGVKLSRSSGIGPAGGGACQAAQLLVLLRVLWIAESFGEVAFGGMDALHSAIACY